MSPHANQVPSRMMLAMGHYSALQSFEPRQIMNPRDLPPTGPRPLWDVLWVVGHPNDQRTDRILSTYDVRYIVSDRPQVRHYAEHILGAPEAFYGRVKALFDSPALVVYQVVRPGAA